jgi:hypothetical protein
MRNLPEEWNSPGKYQLLNEEFTGVINFRQELPDPG